MRRTRAPGAKRISLNTQPLRGLGNRPGAREVFEDGTVHVPAAARWLASTS
jgi:hypothetical protein